MKSKRSLDARCIVQIAIALGLASAASSAFAAPSSDAEEFRAHEAWKETIIHTPTPTQGCFYAVYPGTQWVRGHCFEAPHRYLPPPPIRFDVTSGKWQAVVGNGNDYVAKTPRNTSQVVGTFPKTADVSYERSVGDLVEPRAGVVGPNEYTLQINSGMNLSTSACQGHPGCTIWQQYAYGTDINVPGTAAVFIEYWLINWGTSSCPGGWQYVDLFGIPSCVINSNSTVVPDEPITQLGNEKLSASAVAGGNDTAVFTDGSAAYSISASDSVLGLATAWNESEFNVFGDGGSARADFNPGASVSVKIAVTAGSANAPTCIGGIGTTAETNNLTLGSTCSTEGGPTPYIEFTESNTVKF